MQQDIVLQVGVKILIKNQEGKFLILERSKEKYPEVKDRFDIPGGRINPGTPLLENLTREIKEETGLTLKGEPRIIAAQDILRVEGRHVVRLTYHGAGEGEVVLDNSESASFQWCSREELESLEGLDGYVRELLPLINNEK